MNPPMLLRERPSVPRRVIKWSILLGLTLAIFTIALSVVVIASIE